MTKKPKFSIGSWAFSFGPFEKNPWTFNQVCEYSAEAGYDGIEINGFHPHPHPDVYNSDAKCAELKKYLDGLGLGISGYAPDFTMAPPAKVEQGLYMAEVEKCTAFCSRMGIELLRTDTITPPEPIEGAAYEEQFKRLADNWRAAAELAEKNGQTIVWEFEPGFWLNKASEVIRMVETVDHDKFKLLFDTSHAYMGAVIGARHHGEKEILEGGLNEYARLAKPHIGHFHLIDSDGKLHDEETSVHAPFGAGFVGFPAVLEELGDSVESLDWWCFDFCFCPTTEEDGRKAIPFVNKLLEDRK
ncbi:sugar phosphate isomerase/epimerase family protein [Pelagicoccus mobilis]|uniref:Sugar phosphate isomerase/epimerase n=1 Tax=Pelagicoccus mobilis TaxID=415221 RepID=A0A934VS49_9BACT|nr:sugar phosphate isomerase/epimerase family protein [Pelagicoccus mobilis]MBK1878149.1 sugar phosphate isomerase/epimerase [Pelagicoccus mobilis]